MNNQAVQSTEDADEVAIVHGTLWENISHVRKSFLITITNKRVLYRPVIKFPIISIILYIFGAGILIKVVGIIRVATDGYMNISIPVVLAIIGIGLIVAGMVVSRKKTARNVSDNIIKIKDLSEIVIKRNIWTGPTLTVGGHTFRFIRQSDAAIFENSIKQHLSGENQNAG